MSRPVPLLGERHGLCYPSSTNTQTLRPLCGHSDFLKLVSWVSCHVMPGNVPGSLSSRKMSSICVQNLLSNTVGGAPRLALSVMGAPACRWWSLTWSMASRRRPPRCPARARPSGTCWAASGTRTPGSRSSRAAWTSSTPPTRCARLPGAAGSPQDIHRHQVELARWVSTAALAPGWSTSGATHNMAPGTCRRQRSAVEHFAEPFLAVAWQGIGKAA